MGRVILDDSGGMSKPRVIVLSVDQQGLSEAAARFGVSRQWSAARRT